MRVVTMASMDATLFLGAILSIGLAFASVFSPVFAYVAALILFALLLNIWLSIPLKLNWSRNMYDSLFKNFVGYLALAWISTDPREANRAARFPQSRMREARDHVSLLVRSLFRSLVLVGSSP